jgi:hypothetical protein
MHSRERELYEWRNDSEREEDKVFGNTKLGGSRESDKVVGEKRSNDSINIENKGSIKVRPRKDTDVDILAEGRDELKDVAEVRRYNELNVHEKVLQRRYAVIDRSQEGLIQVVHEEITEGSGPLR